MYSYKVRSGVPTPKSQWETTHSGNPARMPGTGKGVITPIKPTENSEQRLLINLRANNPNRMNGTGSFGKVNSKSPDRTPASTYVARGLTKKK